MREDFQTKPVNFTLDSIKGIKNTFINIILNFMKHFSRMSLEIWPSDWKFIIRQSMAVG
jgi:hypothetical protein